ncbi:MAG: hypothetical protein IKL28_07075 [Lachnospiraceae bacterium]|nr:hypothetical protein [Lachnospiraceae bacterium]
MSFLSKMKSAIAVSAITRLTVVAAMLPSLVGGTTAVTYPAPFSSAKAAVVRAAREAFVGQTWSFDEVFGEEEMVASIKKQGMTFSAETTVSEIPLDTLGLQEKKLSDIRLNLTAHMTPKKESGAVLDATVKNTTLLSGNIYMNEEQLQLLVPKLSSTVLTVKHNEEQSENKIAHSYAAGYFGLPTEQITRFLKYLPKHAEPVSVGEMQKKFWDIFKKAYNKYLSGAEFYNAGEETLNYEREARDCNIFAVEYESARAGLFLQEALSDSKGYVKEISDSFQSTESEVEDAFSNAEALVHKLKSNLRGTVVVKFFVYEKRLIRVTADWKIKPETAGESAVPGSLVIDFAVKGSPTENMSITLSTPVHYETTVTEIPKRLDMTVQSVTEYSAPEYYTRVLVDCNGAPYGITLDYKRRSGDVILELVNNRETDILTGRINALNKGVSVDVTLKEYTHLDGSYTEEHPVNVSVSLKAVSGTVTPLAGSQKDILAMTEKDCKALEKEITKNVTKLLFSMIGLLQ